MRCMLAACAALALLAGAAAAAERTVTLKVQNMSCASCPYIVGRALEGVPGVKSAEVSCERKTAVVTYDDVETPLQALVAATAAYGLPSAPMD